MRAGIPAPFDRFCHDEPGRPQDRWIGWPTPTLVVDQLGDILVNGNRRSSLGEKYFGGCLEERREEFKDK
eukprot:10546584-Alexandrium_andersonii.AAC.1